jgi:predicted transcriptional regulator YdeE
MEYEVKTLDEFSVVGFPLRTDNSKEGIEKIDEHWKKFRQEKLLDKIPNKANEEMIGLYTHYEGDGSKPFTLIAGAKVTDLEQVPTDMTARNIPSQKYAVFTAKGKMPQALIDTWQEISKTDIKRTFLADFEVYDVGYPGFDSEVEIYVGIGD